MGTRGRSENYGSVVQYENECPAGQAAEHPKKRIKSKLISIKYQGMLFSMLAGAGQAVCGVVAKYLKSFNPLECIFYRNLLTVVFSLPYLLWKAEKIIYGRKTIFLWILSAFTTLIYNTAQTYAFMHLPIGVVSAIVFNSPIFTAVFARLFLKEHISRMTIISLVISVIGMAIIVKLPLIVMSSEYRESVSVKGDFIAYCSAFVAVIFSAANICTVRKLKEVDAMSTTFVQALLTSIISPNLMPLFGNFSQLPCSYISWILVSFCVIGFGSVLSVRVALTMEEATVVAILMRSSDIFFAFLFQVTVFCDPIDFYAGFGSLLILASGLFMPIQNWLIKLPNESWWTFLLK